MKFPEDLDLTRVKNMSFGRPNFSIKGRYIYTFFFLFERARQDAGHDGARFFKTPFFEKKITSEAPRLEKPEVFNRSFYIYNKNSA